MSTSPAQKERWRSALPTEKEEHKPQEQSPQQQQQQCQQTHPQSGNIGDNNSTNNNNNSNKNKSSRKTTQCPPASSLLRHDWEPQFGSRLLEASRLRPSGPRGFLSLDLSLPAELGRPIDVASAKARWIKTHISANEPHLRVDMHVADPE
mmetsp:Transcript_16132/g.35405  ORF Transcript_16132/g.35405 Transcript_16132/m.35405 type:complete len:150 (-) Transcript_16132:30-479(-)